MSIEEVGAFVKTNLDEDVKRIYTLYQRKR